MTLANVHKKYLSWEIIYEINTKLGENKLWKYLRKKFSATGNRKYKHLN
jgi:hypothetical protein